MMIVPAILATVSAGSAAVAAGGAAVAGAIGGVASAGAAALGIGGAAAGGLSMAGVAAGAGGIGVAGGAAAGAAVAGGAAAASGGISALTVAAGALTAFTAFTQLSAGRADAYELERRAQEERMIDMTEQTQARRDITALNREFLYVAGQQKVAFANSGFDLGSGSVGASRRQSLEETDRQIGDRAAQMSLQSRLRDGRANGLRGQAKQRRKAGLFGAIGNIGSFLVGQA